MLPRLLTTALLTFLLTSPASAWWDGGHKVIAYIAYDHLTSDERAWVMSLLEANPTHQELFLDKIKDELTGTPSEDARQRWYFGQASVWADLIRYNNGYSNAQSIKDTYDRPDRHYTDFAIFTSESARLALKEHDVTPVTAWTPDLKEPDTKLNSMQAFAKIEAQVPDTSLPVTERAVELMWLFHLVGDTHQPCHCAQLFDPEKFPAGDRGGNGVMILGIKQKSPGDMNSDVLHAFWDSLFNGKTNTHIDILERSKLLKANPALWTSGRSVIAVTDPLAWLKEGRAIAATSVYSPELLDRIAKGRAEVVEKKSRSLGTRLEHTVMASMPTLALNAYVAKARTIADQQAVTSGLRLAASIKRLHARSIAPKTE
jgi:hypothetical protein